MLADPPGSVTQASCFVLGYDVLGPQSGTLYGYSSLGLPPQVLDPLRGPYPGSPGPLRTDLLASSSSPFPEAALYPLAGPAAGQDGAASEQSPGSAFWDVACRHTRLFCLVAGGQLGCYDTRTLGHPSSWTFPRLPGADSGTRLQVGESLVYGLTRVQGTATLWGFDLGTGKQRIQLPLPFGNGQVLVAGGELLVVGEATSQQQRLERYSLARFAEPGSPGAADRTWEVSLGGQAQSHPPGPVRLGMDFVLASADGMLYRWGEDPADLPQVLWPNPPGARLDSRPIALGRQEVGFLADAGPEAGLSLVRIQAGPDGQAQMKGVLALPALARSRARQVTAWGGVLYFTVQPAGAPLTLHSLPLERGAEAQSQEFCVLPGSHELEVRGLQAMPWQGEVRLLLESCPSASKLYREFHLVHPHSGHAERISWTPLRDAQARILWEAGRAWRVDLSKGHLQVLS